MYRTVWNLVFLFPKKKEVSIHVTILNRHAILEYDGIDINDNDPIILTEHFLVISPDQKHDHHFTHEAQKLIRDYLISISCECLSFMSLPTSVVPSTEVVNAQQISLMSVPI